MLGSERGFSASILSIFLKLLTDGYPQVFDNIISITMVVDGDRTAENPGEGDSGSRSTVVIQLMKK